MRVLIFGNSGSGKSTLAAEMASRFSLAHLDLDRIVWAEGEGVVQRSNAVILHSLQTFLHAHDRWVIEGCYGELIQEACPHCTEMVFLNPGLETCLLRNRTRPWEPHKYDSKVDQDEMLATLQAWVTDYYDRDDAWSYRAHRRIFDEFSGPKREQQ